MNTPAHPPIPVGLGTKLGVIAGALAGLFAAVSAFASGDHSQETLGALIVAGANLLTVVGGRSAQAVAAILAAGKTPDPEN